MNPNSFSFDANTKNFESRLKAAIMNERKNSEIEALEKVLFEMEQLIQRTRHYISECRSKIAVRESMLKLTLPISNIVFTNSILSQLPKLPQRINPKPKVLDDFLVSYLLVNGYIKPDFSEEEEDCLRSLPMGVEREIEEEQKNIPDAPESPEEPPCYNHLVIDLEDPEPEPEESWAKKLSEDMEETEN